MCALSDACVYYEDRLKVQHDGRMMRLHEIREHIWKQDRLAEPLYRKIVGLYNAAKSGKKNMISMFVDAA